MSIAEFISENGVTHKFPIDTTIALKKINIFGYGVRPVGNVVGYTHDGEYIVNMERDKDADFFEWIAGKHSPSGKRTLEEEVHFRKNIEKHFKEVAQTNPDVVYT